MAILSLGDGMNVTIETLEKKPYELRRLFAVSTLLMRRLPDADRPTPTSRETADVLGIGLDVEVFEFPDERAASEAWNGLAAAFETRGIAVVPGNADGAAFNAPALTMRDAAFEERFLDEEGDKDNYRAAFRSSISADAKVLARFSRATGLRVVYGVSRRLIMPPLPAEDGTVNVLVGMRPPGTYRNFSVKVRELFGRKVWADGEERQLHGPTQWRGRIVAAEGIPVFQVLGSTYYQLILIHSDIGNGFERMALWEKMLALAARDVAAPPPPVVAAAAGNAEDAVLTMAKKRGDDLSDRLRRDEFEISDLQKKFAEKLRERDDKIALLKALRIETADLAERCRADLARLRALEGVDDVRLDAEDGLLVVTAPIALERGGRRYDLGPFRIQIGSAGEIAVWSETPKHPKGHHHPHVDRATLECLGNVTLSVTKLASAYRFADAVTMLLRWLRSYRPETTLIPLEEFPSEPIAEAKEAAHG